MVNKIPGTTGHIVKPGEEIRWKRPDKAPEKLFNIHFQVVFEDEVMAVVNKPAGIVVSGNQFRTLENALPLNLYPSTREDALIAPYPVHRLDAATSGLILIAKTAAARIALSKQLENKEITKTYQAVVIGKTEEQWRCNDEIDDKPALTEFKKIKAVPSLRNGTLTLIQAMPVTGRTHQIRKHLSAHGFPILGDKLYGKEGLILKGKGLFLCATGVRFIHPETKESIALEIEPPHKFQKFMADEEKRFKKYG